MAVYSFAPPEQVMTAEKRGRAALPKAFLTALMTESAHRCAFCNGRFERRLLQADHRVPYDMVGDRPAAALDRRQFLVVCRSCNRAKSWTCEHCSNWTRQDVKACTICYWASPEHYLHVATEPLRRLDLVWSGPEIADYELLKALSERLGSPLPDFVKEVLARHVRPPRGRPGPR